MHEIAIVLCFLILTTISVIIY